MSRAQSAFALSLVALPLLALVTSTSAAQSAREPIPLNEITRPPAKGGAAQATAKPRTDGRPKLVVLVVADQFRTEYLTRFSADFAAGGLRRLLREGAVFEGHYGQQNTYTGPGHSLIVSGSYGYVNGIVQNNFYNRSTGRSEAMFFDPDAKFLTGETTPADETSPRNFRGTTIGDELRLADPNARVVSVALKERAAIAMGGRMGTSYFQSETSGEMTSSTYYMPALPEWVRTFNAQKLPDAVFGKSWDRLLSADRYPETDDYKFEAAPKGMGRSFPHAVNGGLKAPGPDFYTAFQQSPFGIDYTFRFAEAALQAEKLGQRGVTDLLAISISPTDLAGHSFGPYSQEVHDLAVRLDRSLENFLGGLGKRFKPGEVLLVFTADHGAVPIPEWSSAQHLSGARLKKAALKDAIQRALSSSYGAGEWVVALEDPSVYLNRELIAAKKLDPAQVERTAGEAALTLPGLLTYHTRTQLLNGWLPPTELARAVARSFFPQRGGDVVLVQEPFSFWGKYAEKDAGSTHGSAFHYDTDVPLVFHGKAFTPGGYGAAEMVDAAATLARVLGLTPPAACEGKPLERALR